MFKSFWIIRIRLEQKWYPIRLRIQKNLKNLPDRNPKIRIRNNTAMQTPVTAENKKCQRISNLKKFRIRLRKRIQNFVTAEESESENVASSHLWSEVATDPECRSWLRLNSAFFSGPSQNFLKQRTGSADAYNFQQYIVIAKCWIPAASIVAVVKRNFWLLNRWLHIIYACVQWYCRSCISEAVAVYQYIKYAKNWGVGIGFRVVG